jgi:hypothetical protein
VAYGRESPLLYCQIFVHGASSYLLPRVRGPAPEMRGRKRLRAFSPIPPAKKGKGAAPASTEPGHGLQEEARARRSGRRRGRGSRRQRGGKKQEQKAGLSEGRLRQLHEWDIREREAVCSDEFSMQKEGQVSSSGWQGRAPPKKTQEQLKSLWESGGILELLQVFFPVPYPVRPV